MTGYRRSVTIRDEFYEQNIGRSLVMQITIHLQVYRISSTYVKFFVSIKQTKGLACVALLVRARLHVVKLVVCRADKVYNVG